MYRPSKVKRFDFPPGRIVAGKYEIERPLGSGWEGEVYQHFSDTNQCRYTENRDDQGGWAPREVLVEALIELGLLQEEDE